MRPDMKKCVTERPRSGARLKTPKGEKRNWQRLDVDEYPKGEKIRAKWRNSFWGKEFTDVLGPLYHYLLKQVGRPWNLVYSEITKNLPKGTVQNDHIYGHIWQFVERDVLIVEGIACYKGGLTHGIAIRSSGHYLQMYVNPKTGLLCKAKKGKSVYEYRHPKEVYLPGVKVYPGLQYHKIKGVWYEVKVEEYKGVLPTGSWGIEDKVLGRHYLDEKQLRTIYGGTYIATSKRPLKQREINFACLK